MSNNIKSKVYASLITEGCFTKEPTMACGSDTHVEIDGRLSLYNMIEAAGDHFKNRPGRIGFVLYKGTIREPKAYYAHGKWDKANCLVHTFAIPQEIKELF